MQIRILLVTEPPSSDLFSNTRLVNELERKGIKPIMSSLRKQLEFMGHLLLIIGTHTIVHAWGWLQNLSSELLRLSEARQSLLLHSP